MKLALFQLPSVLGKLARAPVPPALIFMLKSDFLIRMFCIFRLIININFLKIFLFREQILLIFVELPQFINFFHCKWRVVSEKYLVTFPIIDFALRNLKICLNEWIFH